MALARKTRPKGESSLTIDNAMLIRAEWAGHSFKWCGALLMKSVRNTLVGGAVIALAFAFGTTGAQAATTQFSTLCSCAFDGTAPYSDGGVTVQYVGSGQIVTTAAPTAPSGLSWYHAPDSFGNDFGYTAITLTDGGSFSSADLLVGAGFYGLASTYLDYELLNGSTVVATGNWGIIPGGLSGFTTATFAGGPFTELRVQATGATSFSPAPLDALAIGRITLTSSAVPEPGSWAMMILGFLGVGAVVRARRREDQSWTLRA